MNLFLTFLLGACLGLAQTSAGVPPKTSEAEEEELNAALADAGSSAIDVGRALENHLAKYPNSPRKAELERALVQAAIENKDEKRIILYGERVLARKSDDLQVLDRVTRALLSSDGKEEAARALQYARKGEALINQMRAGKVPSQLSAGQWNEDLDRALARALVLEARAAGNIGKSDEATALARRSYEAFPTPEGAREIGRWLARTGREEEAITRYADAFTLVDPRNTDADRAKDRVRMGELYRHLNGSEKGLGDLLLAAYDRTSALLAERRGRLQASDANRPVTSILDFTLSGSNQEKLPLSSLKGKTVVLDFWATWCGPCRLQHPLYEEVKRRFASNPQVVFVSVNTDEDRELVKPFLAEQQWHNKVFFEDGLSRFLQISSIPTTIVVDGHGQVAGRINGFVPDRFVRMLNSRIEQALRD